MYQLKYYCEFDSILSEDTIAGLNKYIIYISQKDYTGTAQRVIAAATPVLHNWNTDEPFAPIKGSQLEINLINDGQISLTSFMGGTDDAFKVILVQIYNTSTQTVHKRLFEGFLVQDDNSELYADYAHEIQLSATDGLGLLKDVSLDKAYKTGLNELQTVDEDVRGKHTLIDIIKHCLYSTGLGLNTYIYANLHEVNQNISISFLEQTWVDTKTFLNSDTVYKGCYDVLTEIMLRFNLCLFQANGDWNIVKWYDANGYKNQSIDGIIYNNTFTQIGTTTFDNLFNIGKGLDCEFLNGAYIRAVRPFGYAKEKFYFKQTEQLINGNLQQLGSLVSSITTGTGKDLQTIERYNVSTFDNSFSWSTGGVSLINVSPIPNRYVEIIKDYTGREIERRLAIQADNYPFVPSLKPTISFPYIEVNEGDIISLSFDLRSSNDIAGYNIYKFGFNLVTKLPLAPKGSNNKSLKEDGSWSDEQYDYAFRVEVGDNTNEWHSISVKSNPIPFSGRLYINLNDITHFSLPSNYSYYKNFNLDIEYILGSKKAKGQTHTLTNQFISKNNDDIEIFIDDAVRGWFNGVMFLSDTDPTILQQPLTALWRRDFVAESNSIGNISVVERTNVRSVNRLFYEGNLFGLVSGEKIVSPLTIFYNTLNIGSIFVCGKMNIDYRNNIVNTTLYEIYNTETDTGSSYSLAFDYIYEN